MFGWEARQRLLALTNLEVDLFLANCNNPTRGSQNGDLQQLHELGESAWHDKILR